MKINCDYGEGYGRYDLELDTDMIASMDLMNVACGFHGGDPKKILTAIQAGRAAGLKIGAHPGYYDLRGFGRYEIKMPMDVLYADLVYQISAIEGMCRVCGSKLHHVKPHGALYNQCASDPVIAETVVRSIRDVNPELVVVGLSGSLFLEIAENMGMKTYHEVFADRRYTEEGQLMSRQLPGALLRPEEANIQCQNLSKGFVVTEKGKHLSMKADTLCVHGDGPFVREIIASIKKARV